MILTVTISLLIYSIIIFFKNENIKWANLKEFTDYIDERVPDLMNEYEIPGVCIAIVKEGKTVWSNAYGYADIKNGRKMTVDTYCRVESISKSVTAWGVMKLVEKGIIDIDKPIIQYIHSFKFPKSNFSQEEVTIRQLLSHSAGMPLGDFKDRFSPKEKIPSLRESLFKEAVPFQKPGISFSYSNTGFNLLELLIEDVTGRDFAEYMEEEVLRPLGMKRSSFNWSESFNPEVPFGYDLKGNEVPVYVYPKKASGGLFASVGDIASFISAGMTDFNSTGLNVLDSKSINLLYTPVINISGFYGLAFDSYGLGHFIENISNGKQSVSHGGQGYGYMTHFQSVPKTGDGIVILTNSQRSWPFFAYILDDWAKWCGLSKVGFSKIILGERILWGFILLILFFILWKSYKFFKVYISKNSNYEYISKKSLIIQLIQGLISVVLFYILFWSVNQDYLFLTSVFPITSKWLGFSIFGLAFVLFFSTMFYIKIVLIENLNTQKIK